MGLPMPKNHYIGTALHLDFHVKWDKSGSWRYVAHSQMANEISSQPFSKDVIPTPMHWATWVVLTIEPADKSKQYPSKVETYIKGDRVTYIVHDVKAPNDE